MSGLFDNFNKTMGVDNKRIDAQQTETAVAIGNYMRDLSGSNSRPDAALPMQDGRHMASSTVLNQYAIAGQEVSPEINAMLDELDQLSIASQSIAGMDNKTRIGLIARGNHGVDPARIKQKEAQLLTQIGDATRDVITEGDRNKLILQRQSVIRGSQAIDANDLQLAAANRSDEAAVELERYQDLTENMTAKELQTAYNGEGIQGVPRVAIAALMQERAKLEFETAQNLSASNPANVSLFGFGSNSTNTRSSGKGKSIDAFLDDRSTALSVAVAPELIREALEANQEANLIASRNGEEPNFNQTINIAGVPEPVPIAIATMALEKRNELDNKFNQSERGRFQVQAPIAARNYDSTIARFSEQLDALGVDINNPNSNLGSVLYRAQDEYRLAMRSGDIGAANEAVTKIENIANDTVKEMIDSKHIPDEEKRFLSEIVTTGKPRSADSVSDFLTSRSGNGLTVATRNNPAFESLADYTNVIVSNGQKQFEDEGALEDGGNQNNALRLLSGEDAEEFTPEHVKDIIERNFDSGIGSSIMINETAEFIVSDTLANIFDELISNAQEAGDPPALRMLEQSRRAVFGDNHAARKIVGDGEKFTLRENVAFQGIGNDGKFINLENNDGTPVTLDVTNNKLLFDMLRPLSVALERSGIQVDLPNELLTRLKSNADSYTQMLKPQNPEQKALFASVSSRYMTNQYSDDTESMGQVVGMAIRGIESSMTGEGESNEARETIFNQMTKEEKEVWINDRASQIADNIIAETGSGTPSGRISPRAHIMMRARRLALNDMQQILLGNDVDTELDLGSVVDSLFDN